MAPPDAASRLHLATLVGGRARPEDQRDWSIMFDKGVSSRQAGSFCLLGGTPNVLLEVGLRGELAARSTSCPFP